MSDMKEKRRFSRFAIPVVVDAPDLSDLPLVPEEVSACGFKVVVSRKPEIGDSFTCSIQAAEETFENCEGEVVWVRENPHKRHAWQIGILIRTSGEDQQRLAALLEDLASEWKGA